MSEVFFNEGLMCRAALVARRDGQRMAALPGVLATHALATTAQPAGGAWTAYEFLGPDVLLDQLTSAGFQLVFSSFRGNG